MKIREDIAALIRAGHTDTRIAHEVGCSRQTANYTRRLLGIPPVRVLDRLRAEEAPAQIRDRHREPLSPEQQTANREALAAAIGPKPWNRSARPVPARPAAHPTPRKV